MTTFECPLCLKGLEVSTTQLCYHHCQMAYNPLCTHWDENNCPDVFVIFVLGEDGKVKCLGREMRGSLGQKWICPCDAEYVETETE